MLAQVSWLEASPGGQVATASIAEAADTLQASATASAAAQVSWLEAAPGLAALTATSTTTSAGDTLQAAATAAATAVANVSWLEVGPGFSALTATATTTAANDSLQASALTTVITAYVSWLQAAAPSAISLATVDQGDTLAAASTTADPQVAGTWTPALLTRWWILNSAAAPAVRQASVTLTAAGDSLAASAGAIAAAAAATTAGNDAVLALVSSGVGVYAAISAANDTLEASASAPLMARSAAANLAEAGDRLVASAATLSELSVIFDLSCANDVLAAFSTTREPLVASPCYSVRDAIECESVVAAVSD